jgi:hypothetical protein
MQKLLAGDVLTASDELLMGPNEGATPDMSTASQLARRLAELDVQMSVCYHGDVVREDASGQLQRIAQELAHQQASTTWRGRVPALHGQGVRPGGSVKQI